jgi:hypothetical protein
MIDRLRLTPVQTALAVAVALLIVANVAIGLSYLGGQDQKRALDTQYHTLETTLQRLVTGRDGAQSTDDVTVAALAFPKNPPAVELTDLIIRAARESGLEVVSLHSAPVATEALGDGNYRVARVDLRLRGDGSRLAVFLDRIERAGLPTLVVDGLDLVRDGDALETSLQILSYATGE